jgi:hypothetical protein
LLYGNTPTSFLNICFEAGLCLLWLAVACQTLIARPVSWLLAIDGINQFLVLPFANLVGFGQRFVASLQVSRNSKSALITIGVLLLSLPLLLMVVSWLSAADAGFEQFIQWISHYFSVEKLLRWAIQLVFGLPLAIYLFSAVLGNVGKHHSDIFSRDSLLKTFSGFHRLPHIAIALPLALFLLVYLLYIIVMSPYLFSAFAGHLPAGFTYAEYARRGFFELMNVASFNVLLLAAVWLLAERPAALHPQLLRLLSAVLGFLTLLLIATAASKMWMYVQVYGLTLLRFFTSWSNFSWILRVKTPYLPWTASR